MLPKSVIVVMILLAAIVPAFSQGWTTYNADDITSDFDAGKSIRFQGSIDSTLTTYTSSPFQLSGYQGESFTSYPVHYRYRNISAAGTPYVTHIIQGNYGDSTWVNIDTLIVRDSTETSQTGTIDFNGKKCYAYRLVSSGGTTGANAKNRSDTVSEVTLYVPRKDPE
jgi:hypothetical protein